MKTRGIRDVATRDQSEKVTLVRRLWQWLRTLTGDDAYERYCAHHRVHHPQSPLLERRAYYLQSQREKWSGIKRCC